MIWDLSTWQVTNKNMTGTLMYYLTHTVSGHIDISQKLKNEGKVKNTSQL